MKLWEYIKSNMLSHPSQTINEQQATMTYEEVVVYCEMFSEKIKGEQCCAIACNSEMMSAIALLSCFAANITAVPMPMKYGAQACNKILDSVNPTAIITDNNDSLDVIRLSSYKHISHSPFPALIMCTSGTTGKPKGIMLSEKNILTNVKDILKYFDIDGTDSILIARPLYHCAVLTGELLTSLVKGVHIRFFSEKFNPAKIWKLIRFYNITVFCGTPTIFQMLLSLGKSVSQSTLKTICISGECLGEELGRKIDSFFHQCQIYHVYGLTEASPRVSYLPPNLFSSYPDFVGIPLQSNQILIKSETGAICKPNQAGTIWIKGENIMMGYYNNPCKTKATIQNGWLNTGDIGLINETGLLKILGRKDQLIIRAGMNTYPAEIENTLITDSRVNEILAYGYQTRYGTKIGIKICGDFHSIDEVKSLCNKLLPPHQVPSKIELLHTLDKNFSGKTVRK